MEMATNVMYNILGVPLGGGFAIDAGASENENATEYKEKRVWFHANWFPPLCSGT